MELELLSINQIVINHYSEVKAAQLYSLVFRFLAFLHNTTMYYAHPLISYPSATTNLGLSQSPVSERKPKKRSDCNKILLTVLFSLYGALHLAVAVLAVFLIQVKVLPASQHQQSTLNSVYWCLFVSVFWQGANYRRSGALSIRFCWFPRQWSGPRWCLLQVSTLPSASPDLPSLHNHL